MIGERWDFVKVKNVNFINKTNWAFREVKNMEKVHITLTFYFEIKDSEIYGGDGEGLQDRDRT